MKNLIVAFIIFVFMNYRANSQNMTIVYEAYSFSFSEIEQKAIPAISEYDVKYYYSLTIDKGISKFSRDSMFVIALPNKGMKEVWFFDDIYKNYNQNLWIKHSGRYKEGYGLKKQVSQMAEKNNFQWKITQEKQIILGVECIKAVSPKGYTVWYAPKLPYPDGPKYGVFNLPGLVLLLETSQDRWVAKAILMSNKNIQIPDLSLVENDGEINLSYNEIKNLGSEKAIIVDKDTPIKQWLAFKSLPKK